MGSFDSRPHRRRRHQARPGGERERDETATVHEQHWLDINQQAGNQGMGALLRSADEHGDPKEPLSILRRLGKGRPLDAGARSRMEDALGEDLSHARIHTEGPDAQLARDLDARAFTVGEHVAFAPGEFRPGTPVGDAILAHELAHVAQQRGAETADSSTSGHAAEHDADRAATGAVAGLWAKATGLANTLGGGAGPRLRTGLALHRCVAKVERQQIPNYLGPHSRQALEDIRDIERRMDIVSALILFGATTGAASPEGAVGEAVGVGATGESTLVDGVPSAMLDIFVIKGHLILQRIDFLRLDHENSFNAEEREFWQRVYDRVSDLTGQAANRRRSR